MKLKGKKIAFFNALPHHARFLFPIAEEAKRQGARIVFFTSLVDYPFEMEVLKRNFQCRFLIEYAGEDTKEKITMASRQLLDQWSKINCSWHGFRHWSLYQQHRSLMRNVEDYFCLEEFIKKEKPDMFITLHEMNPWGKQIGHLAKKSGVPFITLQEGDYYHAMINLMTHTEYSMANLLWGVDTRDRLIAHKCARDKMIIVGNTHIDDAIKRFTTKEAVKKIKADLSIPPGSSVITFMPNVFWGAVTEKTLWHTLLDGLKRPDIFCVFKWHPQVSYPVYQEIRQMLLEILPEAKVLFSEDPYRILAVSDYCVVMGKTTLGVEAMAFRKPLFDLYNTLNGEEYYKDIGVAQSVSPAGNWEALFNTMEHGVPEEIRQKADEYVERVFYKLDGKTIDRAINVISYIFKAKHDKPVFSSPLRFAGGPVCSAPVSSRPVSTGHMSAVSVANEPVANEPVANGPVSIGSVANEHVSNEPVANEPVSIEHVSIGPVAIEPVPGGISFIVPSGNSVFQLLATLHSISRHCGSADSETIVVAQNTEIRDALAQSSEGLKIVDVARDNRCKNVAWLLNRGVEAATGRYLVFLLPGVVYVRDDGLAGTMESSGIAAISVYHPDLTVHSMGTGTDYNFTPCNVSEPGKSVRFVSSAAFGMKREVIESIGGFDEDIFFFIADFCLRAGREGYSVTLAGKSLAIFLKGSNVFPVCEMNYDAGAWKQSLKFFARWYDELEKDDDFLTFAGEMLKQ